jgi:hypothetical protein
VKLVMALRATLPALDPRKAAKLDQANPSARSAKANFLRSIETLNLLGNGVAVECGERWMVSRPTYKREGGRKGWSTVLVTAPGSWEKTVPRV